MANSSGCGPEFLVSNDPAVAKAHSFLDYDEAETV
jgi:hypothetical protein